MMIPPIFQLSHIRLNGTSRPRLADVSLTILPGTTAIVGYSGAGKTSLLNVLAGMETTDAGQMIRSSAMDQGEFNLPLYWSPQNAGLWPHLTARQHLEVVSSANPSQIDKSLAAFDLTERQAATPGNLSRGEVSRLSVARALLANPAVLIMDEPLTHVDPARRPGYWRTIRNHLQSSGASLILSTHEADVALREAEHVVCLHEGRVVYHGKTWTLYSTPPTAEVASFLGPANVFSTDEQMAWFPDRQPPDRDLIVRPERVTLIVDAAGPFEINSHEFGGSYAEVLVTHRDSGVQKTVIHRPAGRSVCSGSRVSIRIDQD